MAELSTQPREYETIYILRPDAAREVTENLATRVSDVINATGTLTGVENWGRRKLAYNVGKLTRGLYVYLKYQGKGNVVSEVERNLRLQESVLKFQTVKLSDTPTVAEVETEAVKFEHIEQLEEEEEVTLAQTLGLVAPIREERRSEETEPEEAEQAEAASAAAEPAAPETAAVVKDEGETK